MIYLDNAATTFPKPKCVRDAIDLCISTYCGNPGRSGHTLSLRAAEEIYNCRVSLAQLFDGDPSRVVFTFNTTYALNLAIKSLYLPHSEILISDMEHNAVLRPVHQLFLQGQIKYRTFHLHESAEETVGELKKTITKSTKMLVCTHASNICGHVYPIAAIGAFCRAHGITFVVDAAQSAGICHISIRDMQIDALCAPAHKGLYGPQGLGFVIFGENARPSRTLVQGGTGSRSAERTMGDDLPDSFEAGTLSTPLIAGLHAAVKWIGGIGIEQISAHEIRLADHIRARLSCLAGSRFFGEGPQRSGVLLYTNEHLSLPRLTEALDARDVCIRSGLHCAPLAHKTLGTPGGGALRISLGYFNTVSECDAFCSTVEDLN
ncbi:MAG: aminotransferase class V-fold PLP-dependent enzyme [Clostridia bacterium]|nr:aminotransferase class V-fold PLP-dependent enzyme [Clostridia bacterium]